MAGIDGQISQMAEAHRGNEQGLQQQYGQNQDLISLLALQRLKSEKDSAARDMQMKMQQQPGTIMQQREQELQQRSQQEVMQGVGQAKQREQGQAQNNMQRVAQQGAASPQQVEQGLGALSQKMQAQQGQQGPQGGPPQQGQQPPQGFAVGGAVAGSAVATAAGGASIATLAAQDAIDRNIALSQVVSQMKNEGSSEEEIAAITQAYNALKGQRTIAPEAGKKPEAKATPVPKGPVPKGPVPDPVEAAIIKPSAEGEPPVLGKDTPVLGKDAPITGAAPKPASFKEGPIPKPMTGAIPGADIKRGQAGSKPPSSLSTVKPGIEGVATDDALSVMRGGDKQPFVIPPQEPTPQEPTPQEPTPQEPTPQEQPKRHMPGRTRKESTREDPIISALRSVPRLETGLLAQLPAGEDPVTTASPTGPVTPDPVTVTPDPVTVAPKGKVGEGTVLAPPPAPAGGIAAQATSTPELGGTPQPGAGGIAAQAAPPMADPTLKDASVEAVDGPEVADKVEETMESLGISLPTDTREERRDAARAEAKSTLGYDASMQSLQDDIDLLQGKYDKQQDPRERWFDRFIAFTTGAAGRTSGTALAGGAAGYLNMKKQQQSQDISMAEKMQSRKKEMAGTRMDLDAKVQEAGVAAWGKWKEEETKFRSLQSNQYTAQLQMDQSAANAASDAIIAKNNNNMEIWKEKTRTLIETMKINSRDALTKAMENKNYRNSMLSNILSIENFRTDIGVAWDNANTMNISASSKEEKKDMRLLKAAYIAKRMVPLQSHIDALTGALDVGYRAEDVEQIPGMTGIMDMYGENQ